MIVAMIGLRQKRAGSQSEKIDPASAPLVSCVHGEHGELPFMEHGTEAKRGRRTEGSPQIERKSGTKGGEANYFSRKCEEKVLA